METYLQHKYGTDIFFLTFSGAVFQFQDLEYILEVRDFILREKIQTIYIVNDTSCRFINGIIERNKLAGLPSEKVIEELYIDNYLSYFKDQPLFKQKYRLAELNVKNQINEMLNSTFPGSYFSEFDLEVKGLITSKEMKFYEEIQINNNTKHGL
jgi:carbonic anhydrase